jgi:hypothetical protein
MAGPSFAGRAGNLVLERSYEGPDEMPSQAASYATPRDTTHLRFCARASLLRDVTARSLRRLQKPPTHR